jgi:hypothetical protein
MKSAPSLLAACLALPCFANTARAASPRGIYVVNNYSNGVPVGAAYPPGLIEGFPSLTASPQSAPAYVHDVAGHAIFVPLARILPASVPTSLEGLAWPSLFDAQNAVSMFDWSYLDTLVTLAVSHHKKFSVALVVGLQSTTEEWIASLPGWFEPACNPGYDSSHPNTQTSCAPTFNVWILAGTSPRCISARIPLPWNGNVQAFWSAAANELAAHLRQTCVTGMAPNAVAGPCRGSEVPVYDSLTMVHVPGLSVYDEELRMPVVPPGSALVPTGSGTCPDGRPYSADLDDPNNSVAVDASAPNYASLGYVETPASFIFPSTSAETGFLGIAQSFAQAFPDRFLGLSLLNASTKGIDFPDFQGYFAVGQEAADIALFSVAIAPGRVSLQSDDLGSASLAASNFVLPEVLDVAAQITQLASSQHWPKFPVRTGWQTNHHDSNGPLGNISGANCMGSPCTNDKGPVSYYQLIKDGWEDPSGQAYGTRYLEVFPADVVTYPISLRAAKNAGFFPRR